MGCRSGIGINIVIETKEQLALYEDEAKKFKAVIDSYNEYMEDKNVPSLMRKAVLEGAVSVHEDIVEEINRVKLLRGWE